MSKHDPENPTRDSLGEENYPGKECAPPQYVESRIHIPVTG